MAENAVQQSDFASDSFWLDRGDVKLFVREWFNPSAPSKNVVVLFHGMAEHTGRYERFARKIVAAGFHILAMDCRGHGKSIPENGLPGYFGNDNGWQMVVDDAIAMIDEANKRFPDGKTVVFAHSMGSYITQTALPACSDKIDAVLFSGTADGGGVLGVIGSMVARFENWRLDQKPESAVIKAMSFADWNKTFKPNRTAYDWLSRDDAEVDKYADDPLCGFPMPVKTWSDVLTGVMLMDNQRKREQIRQDLPILLATGGQDPANRMGQGVRDLEAKYQRAGLQDVSMLFYDDARHEILNESNRDEVMKDMVDWMTSRTGV